MAISKKVGEKSCQDASKMEKCPSVKSVCKSMGKEKLNSLISERAYNIWEEKGRPEGQDLEIWLQAERDVLAKIK